MTDRHLVVFAVTAALVYATVPFRVGDIYPLCRFAMFSQHTTHDSRLVLRTTEGRLRDVRDFEAFVCPEPVDFERGDARCTDASPHASYNEKHGALFIAGHPAADGADTTGWVGVTVERELVAFPEPYGPPVTVYCAVGRCLAAGEQP